MNNLHNISPDNLQEYLNRHNITQNQLNQHVQNHNNNNNNNHNYNHINAQQNILNIPQNMYGNNHNYMVEMINDIYHNDPNFYNNVIQENINNNVDNVQTHNLMLMAYVNILRNRINHFENSQYNMNNYINNLQYQINNYQMMYNNIIIQNQHTNRQLIEYRNRYGPIQKFNNSII